MLKINSIRFGFEKLTKSAAEMESFLEPTSLEVDDDDDATLNMLLNDATLVAVFESFDFDVELSDETTPTSTMSFSESS